MASNTQHIPVRPEVQALVQEFLAGIIDDEEFAKRAEAINATDEELEALLS